MNLVYLDSLLRGQREPQGQWVAPEPQAHRDLLGPQGQGPLWWILGLIRKGLGN